MPKNTSLYDSIVVITTTYLGPAAERFVERQIQSHLHKKPQSITQKDLSKLIDWISLATVLMTEDSHTVEEYTKKLRELVRQPKQVNW